MLLRGRDFHGGKKSTLHELCRPATVVSCRRWLPRQFFGQKRASAVAAFSAISHVVTNFSNLLSLCPTSTLDPNLQLNNKFRLLRPSSPAWQSQDIAPAGISIPTEGLTNGTAMVTDDQNWGAGGGRSPRDRNGDGPRRSRSRSPIRDGGRNSERGLVPRKLVWGAQRNFWLRSTTFYFTLNLKPYS